MRWPILFALIAMLADATLANAQDVADRRVDFGVNGHPLVAGSYENLPLERQIALLQTLGLKTYRVNINPSFPGRYDRLSRAVDLAQQAGIRILPVVVIPPKSYSDERTAYADAKAMVTPLVKEFGARLSVWELGNEYDLYCVKPGADGASPADYDDQEFFVARGLIQGMLAALRENSPSAQAIVETSQHTPTSLDSGFLQRLIDDGVRFDLTGYHYYSNSGHVPAASNGANSLKVLHDEFRKPIWITEFDKAASGPDTGPNADPTAQAMALTAAMREIAGDAAAVDVENADIYELLDEPKLLTNPNVNPAQAAFGILKADGDPTAASEAVQKFLRDYERRS